MDESKVVARYQLRLVAPDGSVVKACPFNIWKNEPSDVMEYQSEMLGKELCRAALHREGMSQYG